MFKYLTQKWKQKRGFTLMEVMVVVAILAVIAGIAIPSVINMRKNMKFTERNDYAKAIFMAAQANLTEMRSKGELSLIIPEDGSAKAVKVQEDGTPPPSTYIYTWNSEASIFDCVLPANSIDSAVRNGQIIIEYNPAAGIVYSVFYYDDDDMDLKAQYASGALTRDEEGRKELLLGYYSVGNIDALDAQALDVIQIASSLSFTNAMEGTLSIVLPTQHTGNGSPEQIIPDDASYDHYQTYLEVSLTITGENSGSFTTIVKPKGEKTNCSIASSNGLEGTGGNMVHINVPIDSLKNGSFNSLSGNLKDPTNPTSGPAIAPGDNVTITAEVTFYPDADDPIVMIESSTIAGINPLYHSLTQNPVEGGKPYILAISNARHLQNLQHLDGAFADANIESIVFVAQTEEVPGTNSGGSNTEDPSTPSSNPAEPSDGAEKARTAGTPNGNEASESQSTPAENTEITIDWADAPVENFTPIKFSNFNNGHKLPKIIGNGVEIKNLTISTTGTDTTGSSIGLFSVLKNTSIEGITLTNPTVTNNSAFLTGSNIDNAATTGALIGTAEGVTVKECCVSSSSDASYISGNQFVGGLVGFVKGNSTFEDCTANVTVKNVSSTAESTDNLPHILGGLVGYVEGSTATGSTPIAFTNCTTTATVTATTATDLGGMAGKAENASFIGCSTEATVTGADGVLSNIGGLVGEASNVAFTNCDSDCENSGKDGAILLSGPNAGDSDHKQRVGGLVGLATGGNFTNCTSNTGTEVTSAENALSDIGGIVGYAHGTTFTTCKSYATVHGTAIPNSTAIPNNNLGGFVGYALNSTFNGTVDVTMDTMPQYAQNVGGLIGYMSNGSIASNASINLTGLDSSTSNATIARFGGLAGDIVNGTVHSADDSHYITITLKGTFKAEQAAGATVGMQSSNISDIKVLMNNAVLQGTSAAGLAIEAGGTIDNCRIAPNDGTATVYGSSAAGFIVTNSADITNSYMRGTVSVYSGGQGAGFVIDNNASIERCMANVSMDKGYAFVINEADNTTGTIKDCYGILWDNGSNTRDNMRISQNCSYSYFINGKQNTMLLYEGLSDGKSQESDKIMDTEALTDDWALEILNKGSESDKPTWFTGDSSYPYPKLHYGHFGPSVTPATGNYPYYVLYTDKFGSILMSFDGYGKLTDVKAGTDKSDSPAYSLCCRTKKNLSNATVATQYGKDDFTDTAFAPFGMSSANRLYTIYTLTADKSFSDLNFNTYYPYHTTKDGAFQIRNADQFKNIAENDGEVFYIAANIEISESLSSFSGDLYDTGNDTGNDITITAAKSLVDELSGTLSGLTVTGLTEPMVNEISGGTVTGCDVSGEVTDDGNVGIIAGTMSSGSIDKCKVSGSVSGSGYVGGVVGEVTGGSVSDVNSSATVNGSDVTKSGMFLGYAEGGSFTDCKSTAANSTLPFGNFATRSLSGSATHYTTVKPSGYLYEQYFNDNFTKIDENDPPTTVDATLNGCTFMNGEQSVNAVKDTTYYYNITGYDFEATDGKTFGISVDDAGIKFKKLYEEFSDNLNSETPFETNYYFGTGTGYSRLYLLISVKEEVVTPAYTTDEGEVPAETKTVYTFEFSDVNGKALGDGAYTMDKDSSTFNSEVPSLHKLSMSESGINVGGPCRIKCGSGYLAYDGANLSWAGSTVPETIWYYHQDNSYISWYQKTGSSGTHNVSVTFSFDTDSSFTNPVHVVASVNGTLIPGTDGTEKFDSLHIQSGAIYRTYTGNVIEGHEIFYP